MKPDTSDSSHKFRGNSGWQLPCLSNDCPHQTVFIKAEPIQIGHEDDLCGDLPCQTVSIKEEIIQVGKLIHLSEDCTRKVVAKKVEPM